MWAWGIPIDAASFICVAMAIGLSVDYIVHLSHAVRYESRLNPSASISEQIEAAFEKVGVSIFKGGMSTFTGICLLALSASYVFRLFFKMLFGIVILGLLVGYFLYPSLLVASGAFEAWRSKKTSMPVKC
mmetsp:Transcript_32906/g.44558  ORF Transcript_32906/g.44558 Transcript_32906/m.44558 type:complete len:130 (-) Transcript_32906:113-502(-)